jgi:uncharacterized Zn finger protein (UPF0148 family)
MKEKYYLFNKKCKKCGISYGTDQKEKETGKNICPICLHNRKMNFSPKGCMHNMYVRYMKKEKKVSPEALKTQKKAIPDKDKNPIKTPDKIKKILKGMFKT